MTLPDCSVRPGSAMLTREECPSVAAWREALDKREKECPYPGPRPQHPDIDPSRLLIGRVGDLDKVYQASVERSLLVLDGYSGVGKSSFLQNGLYRQLQEEGIAVLVAGRWPRPDRLDSSFSVSGKPEHVERYVAAAIDQTRKAREGTPVPSDINLERLVAHGGLSDELERRYGESGAVLILDQFEELLGGPEHASRLGRAVVEWVLDTRYRYEYRVIISLRSDSFHLLEPLLRSVRPFTMNRVRLEEIEDRDDVKEIVSTSRLEDGMAITEEAVTAVMKLWDRHRPALLDVQATLYSLYFRREGARIEKADVNGLLAAARADARAQRKPLRPFAFGLRDSVEVKLRHVEEVSEHHGIDKYLISGAREVVRRSAEILSTAPESGGFKIPMSEAEFTRRVLGRELAVLEHAVRHELRGIAELRGESLGNLIDKLVEGFGKAEVDILSETRTRVLSPLGLETQYGESQVRRVEVTAGPMMAASATETLTEEVRRALFAVQWLEQTRIAKKDAQGMIRLVHDRYGRALREWAPEVGAEPVTALYQLTGSRGEHYVWRQQPEISSSDYKVYANVNWQHCTISSAMFRNVVFVNCDFRGLQFESCRFIGVTFVNCLMDDVHFRECIIKDGTNLQPLPRNPKWEPVEGTRLAPSFLVKASDREVASFAAYLEASYGEAQLSAEFFSDTSGVPARLGKPDSDFPADVVARFLPPTSNELVESDAMAPPTAWPIDIAPATGGLAIVGGRLCLLTLYHCDCRDGSMAFHHVSGDGLQLVEHDGGTISVHDVAIRGLSVSRDQTSASPATRKPRKVSIAIINSMVVDAYFADGLTGTATFDNCVILMLINASERPSKQGFCVQVDNSRYQFVVNTLRPGKGSVEDSRSELKTRYFDGPLQPDKSRFGVRVPTQLLFAGDLEAMDYRLRPATWEADKRKRLMDTIAGSPQRIKHDAAGEEA